MRNASRILRNVGLSYPDGGLRILKHFETVYSEIIVVEIRNQDANPRKYVIKICPTKDSSEVRNEFQSLSSFNAQFGDGTIRVPQPIGVDLESKAIVMAHIEGTNLKDLLLRIRQPKDYCLAEVVRLAASALSRFHTMNGAYEVEDIFIRSPYLEKKLPLDEIKKMINQCGLRSMSKSFIDFSAWNIMVNGDGETGITLIDFPDNECVLTPHADLGRFRYSLRVISQHPHMRILGIAWWDVQSVYDQFLEQYNLHMNSRMNEYDFSLIRWFERGYASKLKQVYETKKSSIRMLLEGKYMRKLVDEMIAEA